MSASRKRPSGPPPSAGVLAKYAQAYPRELGVAEAGFTRGSPHDHGRRLELVTTADSPRFNFVPPILSATS